MTTDGQGAAGSSTPGRQEGLAALLRPRSVTIIGMSPKAGSPSHNILRNLETSGFRGDIHLVGRSGGQINGRACHASLSELPRGIDLAIIITPAAAIPEALKGCVAHGVKSAVCFASGFAETGEQGRVAQAVIQRIAREGGLTLLGPNTVGYFNFLHPLQISMVGGSTIRAVPADAGAAIGIIAQSGGIGIHIAEALGARRVPVAYNVTTGNEAVIGLADFVRFYADDARVGAVAIYAEQIREPAALIEAVGYSLERGKPVVMYHPGRSARAQAAAASHTGALAGDHATMRTIASASGMLMTDSLEEVIDLAELLLRYPEPVAGDLSVITASGAICAIAEDACETAGIAMAAFDDARLDALGELLPDYLQPRNPLDLGTAIGFQPELVGQALSVVLDGAEVGSVMLSLPHVGPPLDETWMRGFGQAVEKIRKPVIYVIHDEGVPLREETAAMAAKHRIVIHRSPERAIRALAQLARYKRTRSAMRGRTGQAVTLPALPDLPKGAVVEWQGKEIMARLGVQIPRGRLARTSEDAALIAVEIGFPVVMKAQSPRLTHKSDAGGVLLNIGSPEAARAAFETLHANVRRYDSTLELEGVLVEAMSPRGLELVVGARRDPQWGTVLMVGIGGVWVEVLGDVRLLSPHLNSDAIAAELRLLKSAKLLDGYRGDAPVDLDAVGRVVQRVAALMEAQPEIRDVEINPLIACSDAVIALDVLIVTDDGDRASAIDHAATTRRPGFPETARAEIASEPNRR